MSENKKRAVALGCFDGLHVGHRAVLRAVLEKKAEGLIPTVLLFDVHPREFFTGKAVPGLLTVSDRDEILSSGGFEIYKISFAEIKDMSPREFFEKILLSELSAAFVSCGFNYSFGAGGEGNSETLGQLCEEYKTGLSVAPLVLLDGKPVSSSAIRSLILDGDIPRANKMLGRNFGFASTVFSGDHRGRLLGSPTINQYLPEKLVVPRFGVYAARVLIGGEWKTGVANVGSRPTFDGISVRSETFILDFDGDLYGKTIRTELLEFIRPEIRFSSAQELVLQIKKDCAAVRSRYE